MDFPNAEYAPTILSILSGNTATASTAGAISTVGNLTAVANLAIYTPFYLPVSYTARQLWMRLTTNGASSNIDVGVYSSDGSLIVSLGSTAGVANSANYHSITATRLPPGRYYWGAALSGSGTNTLVGGGGSGVSLVALQIAGVLEQATAFPLPAAMTPVMVTHQYFPLVGMTS